MIAGFVVGGVERGVEPVERAEWSLPEFVWMGMVGRVLRVIRAPLAWLVWPPAVPIARRRGQGAGPRGADEREDSMSITWEFKREAEWHATIGGRVYAVFRRPIRNPGLGEPMWAWMDLDPKRPSACGLCATLEEAKKNAALDGARTA